MSRSAWILVLLAMVLTVDRLPGQEWEDPTQEDQELTASDGAERDAFGKAVDVSGDVVVVGADETDYGSERFLFLIEPLRPCQYDR